MTGVSFTARRAAISGGLLCAIFSIAALPLAAQSKAVRDSINAHATAVAALRFFEYRHSTLVRGPGARNLPPIAPIFAYCEIRVGDYCYGPANGGLAFGGIGTRPYAMALDPTRFAKQFWKVSGQIVEVYKNGVKRELKKIPGDIWLNGELVRIDVERGQYVRAMESAMACKSEKWWCSALRAYVTHQSGMWLRADSAWTDALDQMPLEERCAWLDPRPATDDEAFHQKFAEADCSKRIEMSNRLWWLADPLYGIPGNERRSDHLSRNVELIISQWYRNHAMMTAAMAYREKDVHSLRPMIVTSRSATPDASTTSPDESLARSVTRYVDRFGFSELVMRVGAPAFIAPEEDSRRLVAQYPMNRAAFIPTGSALLNHLTADVTAWDLNNPRPFEFMSDWSHPVRDLEYQVSHFRRGDSTRIIAATDVSRDTLFLYKWLAGSVFLVRDFGEPMITDDQLGRNVLQFDLLARSDSALLSIELLESEGVVGRARMATGPPPMPAQRFTISDLLLYEGGDPLPKNVDEAMLRVRGTTRLDQGTATGVFWEMYGLRPSEQARMTLSLVPAEPGVLGRVAEVLNLRKSRDTLSLSWQDQPASGADVEARAINLDLSALGVGAYTMLIAAELDGQSRVVSRRIVEIRKPERRPW